VLASPEQQGVAFPVSSKAVAGKARAVAASSAAARAKATPPGATVKAKATTAEAKAAGAKTGAPVAKAKPVPVKTAARKATIGEVRAGKGASGRGTTTSRPTPKTTRKAANGGATKARTSRAAKAATAETEPATKAARAPRSRTRALATPAKPVDHSALRLLGVSPGERVRFRRQLASRWTIGVVVRRERDGSIGLTDPNGAARAIPIERIEVRCTGPRGAPAWEPLTVRASRSEQLQLL
jgi:hypothetical protein